MMDDHRAAALDYIKTLGSTKALTRDEVLHAYDSGTGTDKSSANSLLGHFSVTSTLYLLGGTIIFIGIAFLISQSWESLNDMVRILVTLGVGIVSYYLGFALGRTSKSAGMENAFYLLSALTLPVGIVVTFTVAGLAQSGGLDVLTAAILTAIYLASYFVLKKPIFALFGILFGTWLFFSSTELLLNYNGIDFAFMYDLFAYRVLAVAISYLFLARSVVKTNIGFASIWLTHLGLIAGFGTVLALGKWQPDQNYFWELLFPILCFGAIFASVTLQNRPFLTWGSIYLIIYTIKITGEYFAEGFGWPLALVVAGLSIIGIGYATIYVRKKYLPNSSLTT